MKTVVLLTNFSETSRKAITGFLKVYTNHIDEEFSFKLLNTYSIPKTGQAQMLNYEEVLARFSRQDLQLEYEYIKKISGAKNLKIDLQSHHGDLVDVVEKLNFEQPIDLIVMGTKGANPFKELLMESDLDRLVRLSQYPVLVIPENAAFEFPKKVVLATHVSECKSEKQFRMLAEIIKSFGSELCVLNIYKDEKPPVAYFEEKLSELLSGVKHSFHYEENNDIAKGIIGFARQNNAGLLAFIDERASLIGKLFSNSVTNKISSSGEIPLLIIHK